MREITDKKELAEFFRDTLLPYYEQHYREDLTRDDAYELNLESGLCRCANYEFNAFIYTVMVLKVGVHGRLSEIMEHGYSAKESLIPRIEWMKQFIKETL